MEIDVADPGAKGGNMYLFNPDPDSPTELYMPLEQVEPRPMEPPMYERLPTEQLRSADFHFHPGT